MKAIILKPTPIPAGVGHWEPGQIWEGTKTLGNEMVRKGQAGEIPQYINGNSGNNWHIQGRPSNKLVELRKMGEQGELTLAEYYKVCPPKKKEK